MRVMVFKLKNGTDEDFEYLARLLESGELVVEEIDYDFDV